MLMQDSFDLTGTTISFAGTSEPNQEPSASIEASLRAGPAPLEVELMGHGEDPDGEIVSYQVDMLVTFVLEDD